MSSEILAASHHSFTIDRVYRAAPERVFAAFASKEAKSRWFACDPDWHVQEMSLDFRVGGREINRTGPKGGALHAMEGVYLDIVPARRIVMAFTMRLDARLISVSMITVEFLASGAGTRLLFTEQAAFVDGYDDIEGREEGTRIGLDVLETHLAS